MPVGKQLNNQKQRKRGTLRNANVPLCQSVINLIRKLPDEFDRGSFAVEYLLTEYLSKLNDGDSTDAERRRSAAVAKWLQVEESNRLFTEIFTSRDPDFNVLPRVSSAKFTLFVRRAIADVLGPLHDEVTMGSFSGGASTSRPRSLSHKAEKFVGQADLTQSAYAFVDVIHREAPLLRQLGSFYNLRVVDGAKLFTVPKNADIDRCACKEPDINMFLQKGVGRHIRHRLLRFGIDLNNQAVNRELARQGSIQGHLATIDLSSASDTINRCVVEALLPSEWFLYLDDIRSHNVLVDGVNYRTAMFSSMGNGFTFELESLIFWALMKAVSYFRGINGNISVYGDDIIVPCEGYDYYVYVLRCFGFIPNAKKSFGNGPFRESCGGHYHFGEDVTPFYLRKPPARLTDLIRVCNQLRRWILADPSRQYMVPNAVQKWKELASHVPEEFWGGYDTMLDTQLVSHNPGRKRLVRVNTPKKVNELGRYLAWHCDSWRRVSIGKPQQPSWAAVDTSTMCRVRRDNSARSWSEALWEEFFEPDFST